MTKLEENCPYLEPTAVPSTTPARSFVASGAWSTRPASAVSTAARRTAGSPTPRRSVSSGAPSPSLAAKRSLPSAAASRGGSPVPSQPALGRHALGSGGAAAHGSCGAAALGSGGAAAHGSCGAAALGSGGAAAHARTLDHGAEVLERPGRQSQNTRALEGSRIPRTPRTRRTHRATRAARTRPAHVQGAASGRAAHAPCRPPRASPRHPRARRSRSTPKRLSSAAPDDAARTGTADANSQRPHLQEPVPPLERVEHRQRHPRHAEVCRPAELERSRVNVLLRRKRHRGPPGRAASRRAAALGALRPLAPPRGSRMYECARRPGWRPSRDRLPAAVVPAGAAEQAPLDELQLRAAVGARAPRGTPRVDRRRTRAIVEHRPAPRKRSRSQRKM